MQELSKSFIKLLFEANDSLIAESVASIMSILKKIPWLSPQGPIIFDSSGFTIIPSFSSVLSKGHISNLFSRLPLSHYFPSSEIPVSLFKFISVLFLTSGVFKGAVAILKSLSFHHLSWRKGWILCPRSHTDETCIKT